MRIVLILLAVAAQLGSGTHVLRGKEPEAEESPTNESINAAISAFTKITAQEQHTRLTELETRKAELETRLVEIANEITDRKARATNRIAEAKQQIEDEDKA